MFKKLALLAAILIFGLVPANAINIFNSDIQVKKDG